MSKKVESRWFRWNRLIIDKNYKQVIEEFDKMVKDGSQICVGDVVLRNQVLELMGVLSINSLLKTDRNKNDKIRKRKS